MKLFKLSDKKRSSTREKDIGQEPVRRPYTETIERIYINRDLSSQNDTYEVVINITQKADACMRKVQQTMNDYDIGVSRSARSYLAFVGK